MIDSMVAIPINGLKRRQIYSLEKSLHLNSTSDFGSPEHQRTSLKIDKYDHENAWEEDQ
jgi:hypothetical protein